MIERTAIAFDFLNQSDEGEKENHLVQTGVGCHVSLIAMDPWIIERSVAAPDFEIAWKLIHRVKCFFFAAPAKGVWQPPWNSGHLSILAGYRGWNSFA